MKNIFTRYIVLICCLALSILFINGNIISSASNNNENKINEIPKNINQWTGTDYKLDPLVYEILETKQIIHRLYENENGKQVFLSIVYFPDAKNEIHEPENCLSAEGSRIVSTEEKLHLNINDKLKVINLNQLTVEFNDRKDLVLYFYKTGDYIGRSYLKNRIISSLNVLAGNNPATSLIRISSTIKDLNLELSENDIKAFLTELFPYIKRHL